MNFLTKISKWYFSKSALPYWCVLAIDCTIVVVGGYIGRYLHVGGEVFAHTFWPYTWGLAITVLLFLAAFRYHHTYQGVVRYSSFIDLRRCLYATAIGSIATFLLSAAVSFFRGSQGGAIILPGYFEILVLFIFSTLLMWLERIVVKSIFDTTRNDIDTLRAAIYGVREGGVSIAKNITNQQPMKYQLAAFICPEGDLHSEYLMGKRVCPDDKNLIRRLLKESIQVVIVSPLQSDHFRDRQDLISQLIEHEIKILMIPQAEEWDGHSDITHNQLKEVEIEDLLQRKKIDVDMDAIGAMLNGKRILITGAAGSIGSELSRQIAKFQPAELLLIDQAETPMHDVRLYMADNHKDLNCFTIVSSITDREHMEKIFLEHRPEYVFHAAAYKHVPMMEDNPGQAVRNNVLGTRIIADLAVKYGTRKFVMISTDKAVNPTNVMGCSKRICEIYCQSLNYHQQTTQFITTRFGNVLGSNGSVIPIFREQIKKGGPVKVTHPDIIRYFMLISEACRLVLEAGTMGNGGEIFVFDMGEPVKIVDLAKRMIALSGAKDIKIEFTGLRDGEKLYEELLAAKENTKPTVHSKIMVAQVREYPYEQALKNEEELYELSKGFDEKAIIEKMKEIVPEYVRMH